jgi:putative addiction module component (TIGR02574 family)
VHHKPWSASSAAGGRAPRPILELPVQERIHLVEIIWDSIVAFPQAIAVSSELRSELNARLADFQRDPEAGYSWDQIKE